MNGSVRPSVRPYTPLSWMILSKQKNLRLFSSQYNCVFLWDVCSCMVCLLAEAPLGDDYLLWILTQTSMSQLTVQQSYLLCWELLPDRNRKSMGLWYWELMSHPDPAVLPVGTLHSLEWFCVSRRIFVYSHHDTIVFFSETSVCLSVCPSVTTFSLCSHHRIILKFSGVITNDRSDVHAGGQGQRSKVKVTEVKNQLRRFRTVTPVWIPTWWWNDA